MQQPAAANRSNKEVLIPIVIEVPDGHLLPVAPLTCLKWMPACAVTSLNATSGAGGAGDGSTGDAGRGPQPGMVRNHQDTKTPRTNPRRTRRDTKEYEKRIHRLRR